MATIAYSYLLDVYGKNVKIVEVEREEWEIPQIDIVLSLKKGVTVKYRMTARMYKDTETRYDLQRHIIEKLNRLVVEELLDERRTYSE